MGLGTRLVLLRCDEAVRHTHTHTVGRVQWTTEPGREPGQQVSPSCVVLNPPPPSVFQGWVLEGIPQTRLQALCLQQAGVLPGHVGETKFKGHDTITEHRVCSM